MSTTATLPLRLMPISVSSAAHAALIAALIVASPLPRPSLASGDAAIEVAMVEEGEISVLQTEASLAPAPPVSEPQQAEAPAPEQPVQDATQASPPEPPPDIALQQAPSPIAVPAPQPAVERETRPRAAAPRMAHPKVAPTRREVAARMVPAPGRAGAHARSGTEGGQPRAGTPGQAAHGAAYAGRVRAILQGRANALGIEDHEGVVGVSFTIGASGRMESHAITRTSGSGSVDRLIRSMLASASFPPPPGGRFSGAVSIRIQ